MYIIIIITYQAVAEHLDFTELQTCWRGLDNGNEPAPDPRAAGNTKGFSTYRSAREVSATPDLLRHGTRDDVRDVHHNVKVGQVPACWHKACAKPNSKTVNVFRHEVSDAVYDMRHNITAGQVRPVDTKRVQKSTVKPKMSSGTRQVS